MLLGANETVSGGKLPSFRTAFISAFDMLYFFVVSLRNRSFANSIKNPFPVEIVFVCFVAHMLTHSDG